jgi:CBS domain-containing protein
MRCDAIMKTSVESVSGKDTAETAAKKMAKANVGFLPVCEADNGKVIGAVTDRDIALRVVASGKTKDTTVAEFMSREVIACRPGDDIHKAEDLMSKHQKSRMMVTDDQGMIRGVISLSDIAERDRERAGRTLRAVTAREARAA